MCIFKEALLIHYVRFSERWNALHANNTVMHPVPAFTKFIKRSCTGPFTMSMFTCIHSEKWGKPHDFGNNLSNSLTLPDDGIMCV